MQALLAGVLIVSVGVVGFIFSYRNPYSVIPVGLVAIENQSSNSPGPQTDLSMSDDIYEELIFFEDARDDLVIVIGTDGEIIKKIPVGRDPHDIASSPDGKFVVTANQGSGNISVIETKNLIVTNTIGTGAGAHGIVFDPNGDYLYVANLSDNTISIVDVRSWEEIYEIATDRGPEYVGVTPDGGRVFTTNIGGNGSVSLFRKEADTLIKEKTLQLGVDPHGWAISPNGSQIVITNFESSFTYLLDATTFEEEGRIDTGLLTEFASFRDEGELWTTNIDANSISIIDIEKNEILDQIYVGETPHGISFLQDRSLAFVPLYESGEVVMIDVSRREVIQKIQIGKELHNSVVIRR